MVAEALSAGVETAASFCFFCLLTHAGPRARSVPGTKPWGTLNKALILLSVILAEILDRVHRN